MKEQIIQKLTSRKFWVSVVGIVVGVAAAFGINENEYAQLVGLIGSIASAIAYVFVEGGSDKASAGATLHVENMTVTGEMIEEVIMEGAGNNETECN